jgi:hypothetical protein
MKVASEFRGHCPICGRIHRLPGGRLAKHGYSVDYGYFSGVCRGAGLAPLEEDRAPLDAVVKALVEFGRGEAKRASDLRAGLVEPAWYVERFEKGKFVKDPVAKEALGEYERKRIVDLAAGRAESASRGAAADAKMLLDLAAVAHGAPLIPVPEEELAEEAAKRARGPLVHFAMKGRGRPVCRRFRGYVPMSDRLEDVSCPKCRDYVERVRAKRAAS